jgi:NAD(P)H-hydrate epimerase
VQRVARDLEAIVVLEGARSLIGLPSRLVYINTSGNSGLPTAGSGDALKEAIGAMCGLGMPIEEAVRTGLFLYGFAGDLAAREKDRGGITARDILEHLPAATSAYREDYAGVTRGLYNTVEVV